MPNFRSRRFCHKHGITLIGFSPFGSPDLPWGEKMPHILVDPVLKAIAQKHKRSTANVALRWLLQRGVPSIPKVSLAPIEINKAMYELFTFSADRYRLP